MTRTLLLGGYVHTPADPHATAICIENAHVVWTGGDVAAEQFREGADRVVGLDGRLVTPAFVDAHVHLAQTGLAARGVDLSGARSGTEVLDLLAASGDAVVLAHGWDETGWDEPRPPSLAEVDRAVGPRVAYATRVDMHSAVVSSALLTRVPEVAAAQGYAGGRVERDAHHAVRSALGALLPRSLRRTAIEEALQAAASFGIALVHEMGAPHISPTDDFRLIEELPGPLPEVVGYWGELDAVEVVRDHGLAGAAGDLCVDGAVGSRTAALLDDYADAPTQGHLYLTADQICRHVVACTEAGIQAGFHVIGDAAVAEIVAGFERAAERLGAPALRGGRHRLEHLEMITEAQARKLADLGVTASVQPVFDELWGRPDQMYAARLGDRAAGMNPFATLSRAGMPLAFGSDAPVTAFDPWRAVRAAASPHEQAERLTVRAAFHAHTEGGWRAAGRDEGGVLAVGAPASLAVFDLPGEVVVQTPDGGLASWSTNPGAGVPPLPALHPDDELPHCVLTMARGEVVYDQTGLLP